MKGEITAIVLLSALSVVYSNPVSGNATCPHAHNATATLGTCVESCDPSDAGSCPPGELCCSNGCGHACVKPHAHGKSSSSESKSNSREEATTVAFVGSAASSACSDNLCGNCTTCAVAKRGNHICVDTGSCCPEGHVVKCFVNPCDTHACANHPNATCVANYCNGCHAHFYDDDGQKIEDCSAAAAAAAE